MGKLPFHGICALETVVFLKKVKWCDAFNKIQLDNLFPLEVEKFNIKKSMLLVISPFIFLFTLKDQNPQKTWFAYTNDKKYSPPIN